VVARIKIMSGLDIAERRKPQDGKIRFRTPDRQLELRVAVIPTAEANEDVVLRILSGSRPLTLDQLSLSPRNLGELQRLIARPYGLFLCVGPTGSGKTTTLHSVLGTLNTIDTKIWTAEDPIEIRQPGLRQVQVHPRIGFTFAHAMRAFLRADPDVIMIGEMRDGETAGVAIEASLTGHLVLSTLHTNTAPETVTRLLDMGLEPFTFGDALLGVLAQRLARSLCTACREQAPAARDEYELMASACGADGPGTGIAPNMNVWRARGCKACRGSGYKGRVGLHELLVADDALKQALARRASVDELRRIAVGQGMRSLLQDGVSKALSGLTDLKQVLAVCSE
jgi:type II secretory ATPase GspE/PulE/Tfp pilus assembly ATPase PilB-like protein